MECESNTKHIID